MVAFSWIGPNGVMSLVNTVLFRKLSSSARIFHHLKKNFFSVTACNEQKNDEHVMHVFDRNTKSLQRERAASAQDANVYDYLKDEIGYRLADRVFDIKRKFKLAADIGKDFGV